MTSRRPRPYSFTVVVPAASKDAAIAALRTTRARVSDDELTTCFGASLTVHGFRGAAAEALRSAGVAVVEML